MAKHVQLYFSWSVFCVHDLFVMVEESHSRSETWAEGTLESDCEVGSLILSDPC